MCRRKLWLHLRRLQIEHLPEDVQLGTLVQHHTFKLLNKKNVQFQIGNNKVDYIDSKNRVIYETKKSSACLDAVLLQLKHYL